MTEKIRINTSEIPNRAKDLYVQLYCDKKGEITNETIQSAKQSWLSLSFSKKRQFYNTLTNKSIVKKASKILKTRPFLKAKNPTLATTLPLQSCSTQNNENHSAGSPIEEPHQMECESTNYSFIETNTDGPHLYEEQNQDSPCVSIRSEDEGERLEHPEEDQLYGPHLYEEQNQDSPCVSICSEDEGERLEHPEEDQLYGPHLNEEQNQDLPCISLDNEDQGEKLEHPLGIKTEPIVPIIKNGKELYELLNTRKGNNVLYESLTPKDKRFYGNAVCRIKKDFVISYKAYLESLTSRQLFDYYSKIF